MTLLFEFAAAVDAAAPRSQNKCSLVTHVSSGPYTVYCLSHRLPMIWVANLTPTFHVCFHRGTDGPCRYYTLEDWKILDLPHPAAIACERGEHSKAPEAGAGDLKQRRRRC